VTIDYALAEASQSANNFNVENTYLQELASEGVSVFAASGNLGAFGDYSGSAAPTNSQIGVSDPGSQPWVTSVGGTSLSLVAAPSYAWNNEVVWNDSTATALLGGGGGISAEWAIPTYQSQYIPASETSRCKPMQATICRTRST
jgi:kumamolisin